MIRAGRHIQHHQRQQLTMHKHFSYFSQTFNLILLLCLALSLAACGSTPRKQVSAAVFNTPGKQSPQQTALSRHYKTWINTPYKLGGLNKSGIDCSGFVHVTYRDVFNRKLPRSTKLLAKTGKAITQKNLKFGDLVFFRTGRSQRHVGIYINNGEFIHASSSRGVMQSSLRSNYWSQHYWKAKRIL